MGRTERFWLEGKLPVEERVRVYKFLRAHGIRIEFARVSEGNRGMIDAILEAGR